MLHREHFNNAIGKESVDNLLGEYYFNEMLPFMTSESQEADAQSLETLGKEIKELKLPDEEVLFATLSIAEAVKAGDVDKLLVVCKQAFPKLGNTSSRVSYYVGDLLKNATDDQKASWEQIIQKK